MGGTRDPEDGWPETTTDTKPPQREAASPEHLSAELSRSSRTLVDGLQQISLRWRQCSTRLKRLALCSLRPR